MQNILSKTSFITYSLSVYSASVAKQILRDALFLQIAFTSTKKKCQQFSLQREDKSKIVYKSAIIKIM